MEELVSDLDEMQIDAAPRRSTRKRSNFDPPSSPHPKKSLREENFRRKSKPKALTEDKIKKFYMNKQSARFARQALETIYEDPVSTKQGTTVLIGTTKIKRAICMYKCHTSKTKKLCRERKLKRLGMKLAKTNKISLEDFKKRLMLLDFEHIQIGPEKNDSGHVVQCDTKED